MPPTLIETIPYAPGATLAHYRLSNGLNLYLLPDHAVPVVSVQTWVNVGSRHEVPDKTGLAHFFEHLMFGGTAHLAEGEFTARLEAVGAEVNAATYYDWTHYYVNVETAHLPLVLTLEAERLAHLALTPEAVAREREVVANERRLRVEDDLLGAAMEQLYALAYPTHPYGHPIVGHMADIEGYNPTDCAAFYKAYYAPNNVTLVLVGDIEVEPTLALIEAAYGGLSPAAIPVEDAWPEPPQIAERRAVLTRPTASERWLIAYRGPAARDVDGIPLVVLLDALTGGDASILHQALVETEILSTVSGWTGDLSQPDLLCFYLDVGHERRGSDALDAFDAAIAKVVAQGVDEETLARSKARIALRIAHHYQSASAHASSIGEQVVDGSEAIPPATQVRRVEAVTRSDVLRVARRYLVNTARSLVQVIPSNPGADAPEEPT